MINKSAAEKEALCLDLARGLMCHGGRNTPKNLNPQGVTFLLFGLSLCIDKQKRTLLCDSCTGVGGPHGKKGVDAAAGHE